MTAHSGFAWNFDEPVSDELIIEVAECVNANRQGQRFTPMAYAILSPADAVILTTCRLLDLWDRKIEALHVAARTIMGEQAEDWYVALLEKLEPLLEIPEKQESRPLDLTKISIPHIKRKWPAL